MELPFVHLLVFPYSALTMHDERHNSEGEVLFIGFHSDSDRLRNIDAVFQDNKGRIQSLILRMNEEFTAKRQSYSEMLHFMTGELVIQIERLATTKKNDESSLSPLQYVRNYLDEHYRPKISVESLAKMSGYNYDRFHHLFKEKYAVAPLQYILKKRLEYAKLMLYETNEHVSGIALSSRFSN